MGFGGAPDVRLWSSRANVPKSLIRLLVADHARVVALQGIVRKLVRPVRETL